MAYADEIAGLFPDNTHGDITPAALRIGFHKTMAEVAHARSTITMDIVNHAKPSEMECKSAFVKLPHFDWKKDDDFYIKDTSGGKLVLVKYRGTPTADATTSGKFFYEVLTPAT